jgi:hypothetical protein
MDAVLAAIQAEAAVLAQALRTRDNSALGMMERMSLLGPPPPFLGVGAAEGSCC